VQHGVVEPGAVPETVPCTGAPVIAGVVEPATGPAAPLPLPPAAGESMPTPPVVTDPFGAAALCPTRPAWP